MTLSIILLGSSKNALLPVYFAKENAAMLRVGLKQLLGKTNGIVTAILNNAAGLCVANSHYEVGVEHVFLKCLEDASCDWRPLLEAAGVEPARLIAQLQQALASYKSGNTGRPVFSPNLTQLLQDACLLVNVELGEQRIRTGGLLLAFLADPNSYSSSGFEPSLAQIDRNLLLKDFHRITADSLETQAAALAAAQTPAAAAGGAPAEGSFIKLYCEDFTAKAKDGKIDPVFGRDAEIRQIVDILSRRRKNNPILVGEPGVGKTAVMEGLARRIVEKDVPEALAKVRLIGLDMGALEAGAGMKGEFENRLKGVIDEIKASLTPIILFIDEAHTLVGAGGSAGTNDAANLLKPALARGELRTCAATTFKEYKKYFEKDAALARRFQMVMLAEPSVETTELILRGLRDSYEKAHGVVITDPAIVAAAELSNRYISGRFLPDKAIDLLDTACARVKVSLSAKPAAVEDKEREAQALERRLAALERDRRNNRPVDGEALEEIGGKLARARERAEELREIWRKELACARKVAAIRRDLAEKPDDETLKAALAEADRELAASQQEQNGPAVFVEVEPDVVAKVVSDWTGIPLGRVARDQSALILNLDRKIAERVKGQDQALGELADVIRAAKSGLKNPDQPQGVFLMVGPSGVGKTETAVTLAENLFGDDASLITVNMSEFQEKHSVSRLIGSPPGYVGYGEGGMLTEAVRQKPYSVVLLDEAEKAHLDVLNLFYQVFDKGVLSDAEGKKVNFRNTIIMLASNLASDVIEEMTKDGRPEMAAVVGAIRPILSDHFKPALLARMTVLPFYSLDKSALEGIVLLKLRRLAGQAMGQNRIRLEWSEEIPKLIAERCTEVETGARNIDYIINTRVIPGLSREILAKAGGGEMPGRVRLNLVDGEFVYEFS